MASWLQPHRERRILTLVMALLMAGTMGVASALAEIASGTFTGDDNSGRLISGLGFEPVVVIVKGDLAESGVIRTDIYLPGNSKQMCAPAMEITDGILDFTPDGFTLGRGAGVNAPGVEYHWVAFSADPGNLRTSWYPGDGNPDRWVGGLGFQPEVVLVFGRNNEPVQFRTIDMPDNFSTSFEASGLANNHIEYFAADGFRVGSDPAVNGPTGEYAWVAFNADAAKLVHGVFSGNGSEHDVGPIGFGPDYVIVKSEDPQPGVHRSHSLTDPWSAYFRADVHLSDGIVSLRADHFRVGAGDQVNASGRTHYYVAFRDFNAVADLEISQVVDDATPDVGQEVTFDLTLRNTIGPDAANNSAVTVSLPVGLTYTGDTPGSGTFDSGTGIWSVGNLAPSDVATLQLTATVDAGTAGQTLTVISVISHVDETDPDGSNNTASTDVVVNPPNADLALSAWYDDATPNEGQQVDFTLYLENNGPDSADLITVSPSLPAGLTFVSANAWYGSSYDEGTNVWSVPTVDAGWPTQLDLTVMVDPGTAGSTLVASGVVTGSSGSDPVGGNDSASASLVVSNAELAVTISVDNPNPSVGQTFNCTVDLVNNGPDDATDIKVDLTYEAGMDYWSFTADSGSYNSGQSYWTVTSLAAGGSTQLRLLLSPLAGSEGDTLTTLCEIVEVVESDADATNNQASVDVMVPVVDLAVTMAVDNSVPDEGNQVAFTIDLDNLGTFDATGTAVTLTLPTGLTYVGDTPIDGTFDSGTGVWTVGPVAAAGTAQLQVTAAVDAGTGGATLTTMAAVSAADQVDANGTNNTASVDVIVTSADLAVAIGVDQATANEGQQVVFTVAVENLGPSDATGPEVNLTLPTGLTYFSDTPGTGTFNNGTGVWTIGPVAATQTAQLQITATVDAGTMGSTLTTTAGISASDQSDPDIANNTSGVDVVVPGADLAVVIGVDNPGPDEGDQVTYTIGLSNQGPSDATGAEVTVTLPTGMTYVSDTPNTGTFNSGTGVWTIGPVAVAGTALLQVIASVDAGTDGSTLTAVAAVSAADQGDPDVANNTSSTDLVVVVGLSSDLAVAIGADVPEAFEFQQVVYTVDLDNLGPNAGTGIEVSLALPSGLTYVSDTAGTGTFNTGTGVWTIGPLPASGSAQLQVTAEVDAGTSGTLLTTIAGVSAADLIDPVGSNNSTSVGIDILSSANLGVTAAFDNFNPLPGDGAVLTIVLSNTGPNTATGVRVNLGLSPDLAVDGVTATTGNWDGGLSSWTLPALAPSATDTLRLDLTVGSVTGGTELSSTATIAALNEIDPDSSNDTATASLVVMGPGEFRLVSEPFENSGRRLLPGADPSDVLLLGLVNDTPADEQLQSITISNPVTGAFDQATQDAAWETVQLWVNDSAKMKPVVGAEGIFANGSVTFAALDLRVFAGESLHLVVRGAASVSAPDGMLLQPAINSASDLAFTSAVVVEGTWPLIAPGSLSVDGMTAAQIALHPVGAEIFQIGSVRNLALDVTLPSNGGVPDVLTKLNILNTGTAKYPEAIARMEGWADDGDGLFNPAVDTWIAELRWTGGQRFEASALDQPVPSAGLRVFVTVDIAEDALGGTMRLSLPAGDDLGVGMASGNDGPIDVSVTNPLVQTISATDRVIITTAPVNSRTVAPGEARVPVLHLVARNLYAGSRTINGLSLSNITVGDPVAGQVELDGTMDQLVIQRDGDQDGELDGPETDPVIVSTTWENGIATFSGVGWDLDPDEVSHLFVTASIDLLGAANGDIIGAVVGSAMDVAFSDLTVVVGDWPLDSDVRYEVDGMVAAQVVNPAVPPVSLTANEGPVLALDFTVPGNGYLDDTLQTLRLANLGTAIPMDISDLGLYDDQNGNGIFEPGTDPLLAGFTGIGQDWVVLDLALPVPADGRRLFAGLTVASTPTDSATVQLSIPVGGLDMISSNDGPRDVAVTSPTSLLMSTAPLLSNLAFGLDYSTTEMDVTVTMNVKNVGGEDVVNIVPLDLAVLGDGGLSLTLGPQPAALDLAQGAEGTFTWVFAGESQGPVYAAGRCQGTGAVGGQPRGSLASGSAEHVVLDPAVDLDLYPVANMPFSINRGQTGVVPMTLTLLNSGGPDRADLRLERLVVTLDDGDGNPVVPAELLSHVTVNEGANVFCDRGSLETSGQTMTLDLNPPVVVTESEPVTLGLRLDILDVTAVDRFRVILMDAGDLTVVDNVSGLPRTVRLSDASFPVMSAAGSIVSQASGLVVSAPVQPDLTAGTGQDDVSLLRLELTGSGDDEASEVKIGGFAVTVVDTLGQALPDASAYLARLWVDGPLGTNAIHDLSGPADSLVVFELLPQVTVPVGSMPVALTVHGELRPDSALGPFHLRLEPTSTFDARDGNNSADVLVTYQPSEITGPRATIQEPAPDLLVAVTGELPPVISLGARDVLAMTVTLAHPGPGTAAAVRVDTMRLDCLDLNRQGQDPDAILDGYRVFWQDVNLNVPIILDNQQIVIPLGGQLLEPFAQCDLEIWVDVEADAPAGGFELVLSQTGIVANDNNLGTLVPLVSAPGYVLPASSNLTRLQPPSEDVVAGWLDRMPPLMPTDDELVEAMRLVLTNPAPNGAAPAELTTLVLRAADRQGLPLAAGAMLSGIEVEFEGSVWAEVTAPAAGDSTIILVGSSPLTLHPGVEVPLVVRVSGRPDAPGDGLSLGLLDGDVVCTQPGSTVLIAVSPAAGETFPFWTAAAGLGKAALADSYINFPNPFAAGREQTSFAFNLDQAATVSLRIWTPRGESVTTLLNNKSLAAGLYQDLVWDGRNGGGQAVHNGVYLAELKVQYEGGSSERLLRKVAVVR